MNIFHQRGLNSLSHNNASFFKDHLMPIITDQHKKIMAAAVLAIGLFVICILTFKKKFYPPTPKADKNEAAQSQDKALSVKKIATRTTNADVKQTRTEARKNASTAPQGNAAPHIATDARQKKNESIDQSEIIKARAAAKRIIEQAEAKAKEIKDKAQTTETKAQRMMAKAQATEAQAIKIKGEAQAIKDQAEADKVNIATAKAAEIEVMKSEALAGIENLKMKAKTKAEKIKADAKVKAETQAQTIVAEAESKVKTIQRQADTILAQANKKAQAIKEQAEENAQNIKEKATLDAQAIKGKAKLEASTFKTKFTDGKEEGEEDLSQVINKFAIKIIKATAYTHRDTAKQDQVKRDVALLHKDNDFIIEKNGSKIEENLQAEFDGNENFQTLLAVRQDDTIVGVMMGEVQAKKFYISNLALKKDLPSEENVELRLFLHAMDEAKKHQLSKIEYEFKVIYSDDEKKFLEKKYKEKIDFFLTFKKINIITLSQESWGKLIGKKDKKNSQWGITMAIPSKFNLSTALKAYE